MDTLVRYNDYMKTAIIFIVGYWITQGICAILAAMLFLCKEKN